MFWSEEELLKAVATVPVDGFYREQGISIGSIHKLLVHMMGAQMLWLGRWEGDAASRFPTNEEFPNLEAVRTHWAIVHGRLKAFLARQTPESVMQPLTFRRGEKTYTSAIWTLMLHLADHSTYHRGQMNSMIKLAGGKPTDVSFVNYRRMVDGVA